MLRNSLIKSTIVSNPFVLRLGTRSIATKFYDLKPKDKDGRDFSFDQLKGKTTLIVNVASKCGYTNQYTDLQALYDKYKKDGFNVIGFPCNQFKNQEPGSHEEIAHFVETKYGVTFPILKKIDVNGENADDVYKFLKSKTSDEGEIKWNFVKFLIDKDGEVAVRADSKVTPLELEPKIKELLNIVD